MDQAVEIAAQITAMIFLIIFPLYIIYQFMVIGKKLFPVILLFIVGWTLYVLPMELRPYFKGNQDVLFWFGIIPNFGCALALPLIIFKNKILNYSEAKRKLLTSSFYTFVLLLTYELLQIINGLGTFDWFDLAMSITALTFLNLIFRSYKTIFKPIFNQ